MKEFEGFLILLTTLCVSAFAIGFYVLLPYWLITSAINSSEIWVVILFSFGTTLWLLITLTTIRNLGRGGVPK